MSEVKSSTAHYRPETRLVHSGTLRSQYGETSEALFLTQGFVYDSAEQCEARFKGEDPGYLYSRFSNPTVGMFERRMIELEGAEVVIYSATKHIDGQGRCLGGVILSSEAFIAEHIHNFMRQTGPSMSPFNAWVLLKGLETLAVRVRAQTETAARLADVLAAHPKISR